MSQFRHQKRVQSSNRRSACHTRGERGLYKVMGDEPNSPLGGGRLWWAKDHVTLEQANRASGLSSKKTTLLPVVWAHMRLICRRILKNNVWLAHEQVQRQLPTNVSKVCHASQSCKIRHSKMTNQLLVALVVNPIDIYIMKLIFSPSSHFTSSPLHLFTSSPLQLT